MLPEMYGLFAIIGLFVLLALGVNVGISLGLAGFLGLVAVFHSFKTALSVLTTTPYFVTGVWVFTCIPLFIAMGMFAMHSGITEMVFESAYKWVGKLPGGLAIASVIANAGFGACCGSSLTAAVVFTKIAFPEMVTHGYAKKFAAGVIASGGMLSMLIPPSNIMVIYGMLTEQSVGQLLMAGIGPALLLASVFCIGIFLMTLRNPTLAPRSTVQISLKEKLYSLKGVWGVLLLGAMIIGGIYGGIFSPTEAGAAGAMGAFLIALVMRKLSWKNLNESMREAARTTSMLFLIIVGAMIFARFLAMTRLPTDFATWVVGAGIPKPAMLGLFMVMFLVMGCFLDLASILCITLPIIHPAIVALGWNPIWFAMLVVLNVEIGLITPPVGLNVYGVKAASGEVTTLEEVFSGCIPFVAMAVATLLLMVFIPQISTFLPSRMVTR